MRAVWFRFRAELRNRWRGLVAIAVLAGAAGGVTLAAIAGARRTDTAYPRLVKATRDYDVLVNPDLGTQSKLRPSEVERLPQVVQAGHLDGVLMATTRFEHPSDFNLLQSTVVFIAHGGVFSSFARFKMIDGRAADPRRPNEVVINKTLARRQHLAVGDEVRGVSFSATDFSPAFGSDPRAFAAAVRRGELGTKVNLRVVGIGVQPDQIVVDQGFEYSSVVLTPAFQARHRDIGVQFFGVIVRLRGGAASIPAFRRAVERLVPNEAIAFQTAPVNAAKFDRAVRPDVGALTIFAVVVALTGLLLAGQAIARQSFVDAADTSTLHALGLGHRQLLGIATLRAGVVAATAAFVAAAVAWFASPLTPIGPARAAEPHPGLAFDTTVLGLGALAVLIAVLALAVPPGWRSARARADTEARVRPSRVASVLAEAGAPVTAVSGVRMALEPGRGRTAVPVRTTIVALGLAVMLVIGAVSVAASIDRLVDTPRLFGWNWDVAIEAFKGDARADVEVHRRIDRLLDHSRNVHAWSTVVLSDIRLSIGAVPTLGIDPGRRDVTPSVVEGRLPQKDNEVALGARTLRALDASTGSSVKLRANNGSNRRLTVVGRVVLPGVGTYPGSDKTALGEGAVVTEHALRQLGPDFKRRGYIIDFIGGAAVRQRVLHRAERLMGGIGESDGFQVKTLQRPSDILSYERVRTTPIVLAAVLGVLAFASVIHALVTTVRRRRRDLALLATLGFTRRQVAATVVWQATTVASVALLFGLPLGIALGRAGWHALADDLGTVAEPVVPVLAVVAIALGALFVTNVAALVPARLAARLAPATALRSE